MSNPQQPWLIRYSYDPLDQLTSHTQLGNPERHRFYCKNRLVTEVQGAIGHSIVQHDEWLLAQQLRHNTGLDTTLLATDLQRSVLHTLTRNQQPQHIAYSPYGHRLAENALTSLLGFNGERPDAVTENYFLGNGYRVFNTKLMRFNSPDGWSPFGEGGLNSYGYCSGDPANKIDRNGRSATAFLRAFFKKKVKIQGHSFKMFSRTKASKALRAKKIIEKNLLEEVEIKTRLSKSLDADAEMNFYAPLSKHASLKQRAMSVILKTTQLKVTKFPIGFRPPKIRSITADGLYQDVITGRRQFSGRGINTEGLNPEQLTMVANFKIRRQVDLDRLGEVRSASAELMNKYFKMSANDNPRAREFFVYW
ncbi:RHS repeat-associated core domain-containing protein [Pseudomonas sp. PLMAX]|uniref:RHS repeat-associated core domain-containing protein n=1 Tax=Pseudomonas sp. PLMAX TaxID=2201998 RepID=UPI0038BB1D99